MKDLPDNSPGASLPTLAEYDHVGSDQIVVDFLEEHFPELDPEYFLRWSRATLKAQWEAQRRVFN